MEYEGNLPFPGLELWRQVVVQPSADQYFALLAQTRQQATAAAFARPVEVATRYAAVDTGAIEGLYTTNRGFTRPIGE